MKKTKRQRVALFVDQDVWAALAAQAAEDRVSQAQLARAAMRKYVNELAAA
jgi:hypothetical protein